MVTDLAQPLAVRERTGLPLYCGEFGRYERTPQAIRLAWYRDMIQTCQAHDVRLGQLGLQGIIRDRDTQRARYGDRRGALGLAYALPRAPACIWRSRPQGGDSHPGHVAQQAGQFNARVPVVAEPAILKTPAVTEYTVHQAAGGHGLE